MQKHHAQYLSKSTLWDKKAGVRSSEITFDLELEPDDSERQESWHLPSYSAILNHPDLALLTRDQQEFIKGTQLLEFVTKQTAFEIDCVNYVAAKIAHNKMAFDFSDNLRLDALKIYTDEGYHAYYTQKVANQIRTHYGIGEDSVLQYVKPFYEKLNALFGKFGSKYDDLSRLGLVIVGECQIVSDISEEMKQIVYEPIRQMFREHMADEVFHAKFFSVIFQELWPQLDSEQQYVLAHSMNDAMILLSSPRTDIYYFSFSKLGYSESQIRKLIGDVYESDAWTIDRIRDRVKPTLSLMTSVGVFANKKCREIFEGSQLLPEVFN